MKRFAQVGMILLGATLLVAWPDVLAFLHGARLENRKGLYLLHQELAPGMPVARVEDIVKRCQAPSRNTWVSKERLVVSTPVGFLERIELDLHFSAGLLVHARVRDDSGRILPDAPRDF